jgi:arginyl-tRNA synthetase
MTGCAAKALQAMNLFDVFTRRVAAVLAALAERGALPAGLDLARVVVEPPRDASHGDLATNAAMALARDAGMNPRQLADLIAAELAQDADIAAVSVAGPGFINLTLKPSVFTAVLKSALDQAEAFGKGEAVAEPRVNVEYVSANPTGPMHVGHGRGAVFGDALANLLAFAGRDVTREYYINDAGAQVDVLARSAFLRYREALGEDVGPIPEGLYPGDYLVPVGQALAKAHGKALLAMAEAEWLPLVRSFAIDAMMDMIRADLAALNVEHKVFFSERSLQDGPDGGAVAAAIADLSARGLIYEGRLPPPKGQKDEDWEDREQTLFRSTAFGDDVDRPLLKSDGGYTYFASDIAYHKSKFDRGFAEMIDIWGADHGGYIKRMQAAVKAITDGKGALDVKLVQLVKLMRNGEPVKMSKRSGEFVTLREVIDEVGRDAVRFMMLFRKNDAPLEFDLAKVLEQSKDNPVFYVQYAHARCASVFRQAREMLPEALHDAASLSTSDLSLLTDDGEIALIRLIAQYPRLIEQAAAAHEPHRVAFYLYDLAQALHALWNKGKDSPQLRFVNHNQPELTGARLALVHAVRCVLASGLGILGVSSPDEMR